MSAPATALRRDRWIFSGGIALAALVAWLYIWRDARRMNLSGACECAGMKMGGPELGSWPVATLLPLFIMWSVMMVAMMLPSAAPMILTFASVMRKRRHLGRPYVPVVVFVTGYVTVWCAFSAVAAVGQWFLHRHALLSPTMAGVSAGLGGLLLLGAGVFQFTPLKHMCLTHCRAPLEFILTRWREGGRGAFQMGLEHGMFCTGCCWALMYLLFVIGVMNVVWIALLTMLVVLEKTLPRRVAVSSTIGLCLIAWGTWVFFRGFLQGQA